MQSNRKQYEGKSHEDRDAQFEYIQKKVDKYFSENQPVISVDAKKRELVGNFENKGVEWHKTGEAESVALLAQWIICLFKKKSSTLFKAMRRRNSKDEDYNGLK